MSKLQLATDDGSPVVPPPPTTSVSGRSPLANVPTPPRPAAHKPAAHRPAAPVAPAPKPKGKTIAQHIQASFDSLVHLVSPAKKKAAAEAAAAAEHGDAPMTKPQTAAQEDQEMKDSLKLYEQGLASVKDLIAPSSMRIEYDHLEISGLVAQTFAVFAYPRYLETNWLSPVINLDMTMDISMFIYPIDSVKIMKSLRKKVGEMYSSVRILQEKGQVRDPGLQAALEDAEELRDKLQRGVEKFFQYGLYFTIYAKDAKELPRMSKQLETLLGGKLIMTKSIQARTERAFNACLPYGRDELYVVRNMNTEPLSSSFPFTSSELTSDHGVLYGINRHNNSLIIFDRFSRDLVNANMVCFATSGAGKSFAVKLEILRNLMLGTDVIVIDPENEYERLSQEVNGSYLKVSLNADRRINPFDLPLPFEDQEEQPGDLLRFSVITMKGLMRLMLGAMSVEEEAIMDQAILDTYALKGITMDTVNPGLKTPPTMEDLGDILENTRGGEILAKRLKQYTEGIFAGIFNKPTNVDLNRGLVVFSIRDLDDVLRPTAMYIILNYIWNRVRSQKKRRILVIDEAWTMMQHEDSAKFLYSLVKRARKYYLGISTITQDVEDFLSHPLGKPIVTNSALQLLLKQAPSAVPVLKKIFNLSEGEEYFLLNSGQGQGIFFAGRQHVAIQIVPSFNEKRIATSHPEDIIRERDKANAFKAQ